MKRQKIPSMTQKKLYQEAASCCAFCNEFNVATLEIHHIDEDPSNNDLLNLLLVCSSCHSKITHGEISAADVQMQKYIVQFQGKTNAFHNKGVSQQTVTVANTQNTGVIANVVNIRGKRMPKISHPSDSIGADTIKKSYIDYLCGRYFDYRKADSSFGAFGHAKHFHPSELHKTIQSKFKAKTFSFMWLVLMNSSNTYTVELIRLFLAKGIKVEVFLTTTPLMLIGGSN